MANELKIAVPSGLSVYALVINSSGLFYNGSGVETYAEGNYSNYDVPMAEQGNSGLYFGDFPSVLGAGSDFLIVYKIGSGSPSDIPAGTQIYTIEDDVRSSLLATVYASGSSLDALIFNDDGLVWNGTSMVAYVAATHASYVIAATEQGTSGIYIAPFPAALTSGGPFTVFWKARANPVSADAGDTTVAAAVYNLASEVAGATPGAMSGSEWLAYVLLDFIRTDKNENIFAYTRDAIAEIRRRLPTAEYERERSITDSIITLGDYAMDTEADLGILIGSVVLMDSSHGKPLEKISKQEYDRRYRRFGTGQEIRGIPKAFSYFGHQFLVGPVPDQIYVYKINFTVDDQATISTSTISVPYTRQYREILKFGVLWRLYGALKNDDQAAKYGTLWESFLKQWERKEDRNRTGVVAAKYRGC